MRKVFSVGEDRYNNFKLNSFGLGKLDVMAKIPHNTLSLPTVQLKPKDCATFVTKMSAVEMILLRSACVFRVTKARELFQHEVTGIKLNSTMIIRCFLFIM